MPAHLVSHDSTAVTSTPGTSLVLSCQFETCHPGRASQRGAQLCARTRPRGAGPKQVLGLKPRVPDLQSQHSGVAATEFTSGVAVTTHEDILRHG